jgi:hypothetical protein
MPILVIVEVPSNLPIPHALVFFHGNDPLIFKEIKSILENNGYEIHSKWVVINTLPRMSFDTKGKNVMFCPHSCLDVATLALGL